MPLRKYKILSFNIQLPPNVKVLLFAIVTLLLKVLVPSTVNVLKPFRLIVVKKLFRGILFKYILP